MLFEKEKSVQTYECSVMQEDVDLWICFFCLRMLALPSPENCSIKNAEMENKKQERYQGRGFGRRFGGVLQEGLIEDMNP